jgi:hypothetical protein
MRSTLLDHVGLSFLCSDRYGRKPVTTKPCSKNYI